jgi:phosphatidylserine/phosphatidylglycerophosphate/cardiolipin synthase-like enzyme
MRGVPANYRGVYIHSKLALFDDQVAIVGSGNFNGRSMMYDGEMSVQISDPTTVAGIRSALFTHWGMQTGTSWSPGNWYTQMNAFATAPADGAIGAYPLVFTALSGTWPRKAAQGIFDVFNVDPGSVL